MTLSIQSLARTIAKARPGMALVVLAAALSGCYVREEKSAKQIQFEEFLAAYQEAVKTCFLFSKKIGHPMCPEAESLIAQPDGAQ